MAGGVNAIANLLGKVDANGALLVTVGSGSVPAAAFVGPAADNTAAPPFTFTSDLNTGLASSAADTIDLVAGGTSRLKVTSTLVTLGTNVELSIPVGGFAASAGSIRLRNAGFINARNQGNSGDLTLIGADSSDRITLGSGTGAIIPGGSSNTNDFGVAGTATWRSFIAGTSFIAAGANGQLFTDLQSLTELTTIAAAATTDTTMQMPANAVVLGVSVRVTVVIPTATTFTVGDSGSAARFSTAAVSVAANSTDPGTKAGAYYNASALSIRITPNATPGANSGRVRVTIHFYTVTPPTS